MDIRRTPIISINNDFVDKLNNSAVILIQDELLIFYLFLLAPEL